MEAIIDDNLNKMSPTKKRISKSLILVFSLISFLNQTIYAQEDPSIIPPSPEAQAFTKYGDIPVSTYTGVPDITIPIYTIKDGDIEVPISLSYHASGIRVSEEASWVGLGWVLNSGGIISRTIFGEDDLGTYLTLEAEGVQDVLNIPETNSTSSYINYGCDLSLEGDYDLCEYLGRNVDIPGPANGLPPAGDFEPDKFSFSYPGGSGKFILNRNGVPVLEKQEKIDIKLDLLTWTIRDQRGFQYEYGKYEQVKPDADGQPETISAWYLTSITSPTNRTIIYNYDKDTDYNLITINNASESRIISACEPNSSSGINLTTQNTYKNQTLSSIEFSNGEIKFDYENDTREDLAGGKKLKAIEIFKKDAAGNPEATAYKRFVLDQDYFIGGIENAFKFPHIPTNFISKRLRLLSVTEEVPGTPVITKPPYLFEYYESDLPGKTSFAQDHWGYYNGGNESGHIVGKLDRVLHFADAGEVFKRVTLEGQDRSVNPDFADAFSLKRITYPTGGSSEFVYESHNYNLTGSVITAPEPLPAYEILGTKTQQVSMSIGTTTSTLLDLSLGAVDDAGFVDVQVDLYLRCTGNDCSTMTGQGYFQLIGASNVQTQTKIDWQDVVPCSAGECNKTVNFSVRPGIYQVEAVDQTNALMVFDATYSWEYLNRPYIHVKESTNTGTSAVDLATWVGNINGLKGQTSTVAIDLTDGFVAGDGKVHLTLENSTFRCFNSETGCQGIWSQDSGNDVYIAFAANSDGSGEISGSRVRFTDGDFCFNGEFVCEREPNTVILDPGIYYAVVHWADHVDLTGVNATYSFLYGVGNGETSGSSPDLLAGGLRIREIIDNDGNEETSTRKFEYSNGRLMGIPHDLTYQIDLNDQLLIQGYESPWCLKYIQSSGSNVPLQANGNSVGYDMVSILYGKDEAENYGRLGKTTFEYQNHTEPVPYEGSRLPGIPNINIPSNGLLRLQTDYAFSPQGYQVIREIENDYDFKALNFASVPSVGSLSQLIYGIKKRDIDILVNELNVTSIVSDWVFLYFYPAIHSEWIRLLSTTERNYDPNNNSRFTEVITNYQYEPTPVHYQTTQQSTINSEGQLTASRFKYPEDYASPSSDISKMIDRHMVSRPIEQIQSVNGQVISANATDYDFDVAKDIVIPKNSYKLETNQPLTSFTESTDGQTFGDYTKRATFHKYDSRGNILEFSTEDDIHTVYLWGYNQSLPVAKIVNATFAEIESIPGIGADFDAGHDGLSVVEEQALRSAAILSDALITTYAYNPLIGLIHQTDPNGIITKYEYDDFGRLAIIKDHEENILQRFEYHFKGQ